ncbi:MAG: hypothetical protein ABR975_10220, partial [Vulcanimicrobiaceae bacterium]
VLAIVMGWPYATGRWIAASLSVTEIPIIVTTDSPEEAPRVPVTETEIIRRTSTSNGQQARRGL